LTGSGRPSGVLGHRLERASVAADRGPPPWLAGDGTVPAGDVDLAAEALMAAGEGLLLRGLGRAERNLVLRYGIERLIPGASAPTT
jgi:hypothetical protein